MTIHIKTSVASFACSLFLIAGPAAAQLTGVNKSFDPSSIYRADDGTCRFFGTGQGVQIKKSLDGGKSWSADGAVFPTPPAWWAPYNGSGKGAWAPDVIRVGNKVYLYYSLSTLGSRKSCIALAVNSSPDLSEPWEDRGVVVETTEDDNYNAIDPSLIREKNGKLWMAFGSYWSGIKLVQLDPATGKKTKDGPMYSLASRGKSRNRSIEAACLIAHPQGGYVLFVNWGSPPHIKGAEASYEVRMGYSKEITGPYLDRSGKDMLDGGGALFISKDFTMKEGNPPRRVASGHLGLLNADLDGSGRKSNWISYFYYCPDDQKVKLGIQRLEFPVGKKFPAPGLPREYCP